MDDLMKRFIHWEGASRDTIDFKRCYCEITEDLICGVLLSQIIFWFLPDRRGKSKLSIFKDGKLWLCKGRHEWMKECFLTANQFDRASRILVNKGFLYKMNYKFNGAPTAHVSIRVDNITKALAANMKAKSKVYDESLGLQLLTGEVVFKEPKKEYKLSPFKKKLFDSAKVFFEKNNKNISIEINSDKNLKKYLFEHFWIVYDRKYLKQESLKKFNQLSFKEIEKAIEVTPKYVELAGKYKFKPSKYLSNKVFEDDLSNYDFTKSDSEDENTESNGDFYEKFK